MALDYKNFAITYDSEIDDMVSKLNDSGIFDGQKLRLQADCHIGKGCAIGTCLTYDDKIVPSLVGCDIACRVSAFLLGDKYLNLDMAKVDKIVHENVPSGTSLCAEERELSKNFNYESLRCWNDIKDGEQRFRRSIGTMGGNNHFVAIEQGIFSRRYYLVIHCGSRNLGKVVFDYYQGLAEQRRDEMAEDIRKDFEKKIAIAREEKRYQEIASIIEERKKEINSLPDNDLCYLRGDEAEDYLNDVDVLRNWSLVNHYAIAQSICGALGLGTDCELFTTSIHNYVDTQNHIIRKGAIGAYEGQLGIIPMNMRDGSLLVVGKGNEDYLWSAPHGAGRIMSRAQARKEIDLAKYEEEMSNVYTTCVSNSTRDEAPDAYKKMEDILPAIEPTVKIIERTIPVYNYKDKK